MNKLISTKQFPILFLFIFFAFFTASTCYAQKESIQIAVTPFTLNAPENMQYLKSGFQDMLESRLSQDENVIVISKEKTARAMQGLAEPIDEDEARDIGLRLGADYVLMGSLSVFGSSVSLDARLVDSAGEKSTKAFFDQSESIDELVPKINDFAADINAEMVGAAGAVAAAPSLKPEAADGAGQAHPEKMTENEIQAETDTEGKAMVVDPTGGVRSTQFWKSRTYKINIHGMALGDVDGDRKIETVVITGNQLLIFRSEANKFYKIYELKQSSNKQFIGVDVGDINENGMAEIFVSGLTPQRTSVSSFVLEYDGKEYQTTVNSSRRLYRVVHQDGQPPMLFGQDFIPKIDAAQPIYRLHAAGTSYTPGDNIIARDAINLMGFAYGNVLTRDSNGVVAYSYADRLELFDENGIHEWTSSEHLGGSTLSFSKGIVGQGDVDYRFLPMRVLLKDLDHDGQQEVIAVKNYEIASRTLKDFRMLTDFHIVSLSWDGLGLQSNWQTPKTSGHIRDYAIGDFDNDGQDELVAAVVMREDRIIGVKPKSAIIAYEMAARQKP